MPLRFNTRAHWGCPYDCGLCPDHEQHSCLTLVEITDHCNLTLPDLLRRSRARSGRSYRDARDRSSACSMRSCANEGEPDVVQISGGEPTLHPEFFAILDAAQARPIRHLMVNTNGMRIAKEPDFARAPRRRTRRASRSTCSSTRSSATRSLALRGADLRRRPRAGARARSTSTTSRPRWSSRSRRASTTTRSARSSTSRSSSRACAA